MYSVQERYGLWLYKDYIAVQRMNEWITVKGSAGPRTTSRRARGDFPIQPPQTRGVGFVPPIPDFATRPIGTMPNLSYRPSPAPISSTFGCLPNGEPIAVWPR